MEKEVLKNHHHPHNKTKTNSNIAPSTSRHVTGERFIKPAPAQSADFVLRWGSRKRLRCMKIQVKNDCTTVRVDRRIVGSDNNSTVGSPRNGHFNPRQRPAQPPLRVLRNTEGGSGMKGHNSNNNNTNQNQNQNQSSNGGGGMRGLASPEREKKHHHHNHHHENMLNGNGGGRTASSGGGGGSSSGGGSDVVWPPKFVIALTNKEKEEDFMAIKGSKLPQRPKKRAKFIQRTLNLVSPGGWLCDLTLERYEVREKKITKKRPRGLKALGNYMESDSD